MNGILTIAQKELRDAMKGRWLFAYAATFALIALVLARVQGDSGSLGEQGFNRTTAGLINLCLLLVPLLALVLGAAAVAGERERGTLATLLSQPISAAELMIGKFAGLAVAVWGAIAAGFGIAGLIVAVVQPLADIQHYLLFVLLSAVLAATMLSVGMLVSVLADTRVKALSLAVLLWFFFVLLYDLGAIGLALTVSSSGRTLVGVAIGNPVESVRILAIMSLDSDLDVLGPVGSYLSVRLGTAQSIALLGTALLVWTLAPLFAAVSLLRSRDA